jgi:hypothetical protein
VKVIGENLVFRNFLLDLTSEKALSQELSDHVLRLVSGLAVAIAANF